MTVASTMGRRRARFKESRLQIEQVDYKGFYVRIAMELFLILRVVA